MADPHDLETSAVKQMYERLTEDDRRRLQAAAAVERSGEPAEEIVRYARAEDIDLIIMGTHGPSGVAHLVTGSVAEKIVRHATNQRQ